ncbi:Eco57I restriction-modification methylase domain-containing protein [Macrococcoides bohemicum]|uniref:Eco57I restriction-modification methylase domain-containing protein n=1 Tax=Macrococcoides bohemicum TaxID=1903056 RepID=UPI00165D7E15|nr:N-6 DNA methylase [Macrococcus bohemicus]MBC9875446.1 hypothetical protein [Macrococcus bohemicus]
MEYLSISEISKKWGISKRRVQYLASQGRINGAKKVSGIWIIPDNAIKPSENKENLVKSNKSQLKSLINKLNKKNFEFTYGETSRALFITSLNSYLLSLYSNINERELYEIASYCFNKLTGKKKLEEIKYNNMITFISNNYEPNISENGINELSWSYQFLNQVLFDNEDYNVKTQFFTDQYMINNLVYDINLNDFNGIVMDPCCGGGNMLTTVFNIIMKSEDLNIESINLVLEKLIGIDIDPVLSFIAVMNIKLEATKLLSKKNKIKNADSWNSIKVNIYQTLSERPEGTLSNDVELLNIDNGNKKNIIEYSEMCDFIITNPPFATVKGMNKELNKYLKEKFPLSNSDICVAFISRVTDFLSSKGKALMVVQSSWMFLNSFTNFRETFLTDNCIHEIIDLGSGAFVDISGEKSSVSLIKFSKIRESKDNTFTYKNLKNISLDEKKIALNNKNYKGVEVLQEDIKTNENVRFDFLNINSFREYYYSGLKVGDVAVPMQGTSTGNSKELTGYFWEHFNEKDWKLVSKGGGYSRWSGLNRYVVKWGNDAEYIKEQKGYALRNVKYFNDTKLVFSDTGTSGLNVRELYKEQIFIASGPGIRTIESEKYSLLAVLNSRLSSYYMRMLSPKLTIAAGYIANLPINYEMANSNYLSMQAKVCVESKKIFLSNRPNNYEYSDMILRLLPYNLIEASKELLLYELDAEFKKIEAERFIDESIYKMAKINKDDLQHLYNEVGKPCYLNDLEGNINIKKFIKEWNKNTDMIANLNKVKFNKNMIGADGVLEYLSLYFQLHPKYIREYIKDNMENLTLILSKYSNLILHNFILSFFDYNTKDGLTDKKLDISTLCNECCERFNCNYTDVYSWIENDFIEIHNLIFYNHPIVIKEKNVLKKR